MRNFGRTNPARANPRMAYAGVNYYGPRGPGATRSAARSGDCYFTASGWRCCPSGNQVICTPATITAPRPLVPPPVGLGFRWR